MSRVIDREALAWAAGFFDGEGSVRPRKPHARNSCPTATLAVGQNAPELLERFRDSVGVGTVRGPHKNGDRQMWAYRIASFEGVQAVIAMLWPWLGSKKRDDARRTLAMANHGQLTTAQIQSAKTHCKRGHPFDDANTAVRTYRGRTQRQCRACVRMRRLERRAAA